MALAVSALKEQIEKAKENLKSVDENIKKITGRDPNEPRPSIEGRRLSGSAIRGREHSTILGRRDRTMQTRNQDAEPPAKKTAVSQVFSRLGPAGGGRRVIITGGRRGPPREQQKEDEEEDEEEDEDDEEAVKPTVQSSVISTAKKITKTELIEAQNAGEKGRARNRRMFGMLLGTLARFQTDSSGFGQQTKQAQRQKEIELRLEEQTAAERKKMATQRRTLFNERRAQQKRIQLLEQKVALADELVDWEKEWKKKSKFIMTKATPAIFFSPKDYTPRTQRALKDSQDRIQNIIEKHRKSVEETMNIFDAEIKNLENKPEDQDGKRGNSLKNGDQEGVNGSKNIHKGKNDQEPEEEMDLDSMGPQLDIKVEMDDNEGDYQEKGIQDDYIRVEEGLGQDVAQEQTANDQDQGQGSAVAMEVQEDVSDSGGEPYTASQEELGIELKDDKTASCINQGYEDADTSEMHNVDDDRDVADSPTAAEEMVQPSFVDKTKASSSCKEEGQSELEIKEKPSSSDESGDDAEEKSGLGDSEKETKKGNQSSTSDESSSDDEHSEPTPSKNSESEHDGDAKVTDSRLHTDEREQFHGNKADGEQIVSSTDNQKQKKINESDLKESPLSDSITVKVSPIKNSREPVKEQDSFKKKKSSEDSEVNEDEVQTQKSLKKLRSREKSESSSSDSSEDSSSEQETRKKVVPKKPRRPEDDRKSSRRAGNRHSQASRKHSGSRGRSRSRSRDRHESRRDRHEGKRDRRRH